MTSVLEPSDRVPVTVVIPFYQREKGILARALASVEAQELPDRVALRVIVVDDSSPVRAADEIAEAERSRFPIDLIEQPNGGPGSARNAALDSIASSETRFIAFLDSDDTWKPSHIGDALRALGEIGDFYFCDHSRFDSDTTWFEGLKTTSPWKADPGRHLTALDGIADAYTLDNENLFQAFLQEYLSQTSTVVYRWDSHRTVRFDTEQRSAGEDHLFWLELVRRSRMSILSMRANVHCGRGVNIYYDSMAWNSSKVVDRFACLLLFRLKTLKKFELSAAQLLFLNAEIRRLSRAHGFLFLLLTIRSHIPDLRITYGILRRAPTKVLLIPYYFLSVLPNRKTESAQW